MRRWDLILSSLWCVTVPRHRCARVGGNRQQRSYVQIRPVIMVRAWSMFRDLF